MKGRTVKNWGPLIRNRRKQLCLSQKELADKVGCDRTTIIKAEQDPRKMKLELILAIMHELYLGIVVVNEWKGGELN